jgi:hypothetical protein
MISLGDKVKALLGRRTEEMMGVLLLTMLSVGVV